MKRLIIPLVVLLTLSLIAALLVQERQAQKFDTKVAELSRALLKSEQHEKQLAQKLASAEENQQILKSESDQLRTRLHEIAAATPEAQPDAAPSPTPSEPKNPFSGMLKKMMADPQMKKAMAQQQLGFMRQYYADFIKMAGLTPQESDKFFEILGKREEARMEAGANLGAGNPAKINEHQDELKTLLGDDRAKQFKDFEKSVPDRIALSQINQQLSSSGAQLNDSQTNSLLQIYSEERANGKAPDFKMGSGDAMNMSDAQIDQMLQYQSDLNQRIDTRASSLLTPQQMEKLQAAQKQALEMQKMGMKMAKQMLGPGK